MKRVFLIDAYALIFRSYYAFISRPMRNREGMNTSAVFGFVKFLRDIIVNERPRYLGVAFDPHGGSFRNELYPLYKANRSETPEDIVASVPYIKRILAALRIPILEVAGYEADDVIGTISHQASEEGYEVYMVTPDKDFGQLVRDNVFIYRQRKGGEGVEILGPAQIEEHYGFRDPRLVIDILALWGDASDNIPGVQGIGEKGAMKLVNQFGSVENILANVDKIKGRQHDNLVAGEEQLRLSKRLATIALDAPIRFVAEELEMERPDCEELRKIYTELDFNMFLREMESRPSPFNGRICYPYETEATAIVAEGIVEAETPKEQSVQTDLFGRPVAMPTGKTTGNTAAPSVAEFDLFSAPSGMGTVDTVAHEYVVADSREAVEQMVKLLRGAGRFCFDTETSGLDCFRDRVVGLSFSCGAHRAWYVPAAEWVFESLKELFEDPAVEKVGQNMKFDIMMLRRAGIEVRGFKYDTMLLHYLLDSEARHNMDYLAQRYLDYMPIPIKNLIGSGTRQLTMDRVPMEQVAEYAAEDADVTWQLFERLWPEVCREGLEQLYRSVEEPLIDVLADIEMAGVRIDTGQLAAYAVELNEEMADLEGRIRSLAGMPELNINSSRQLGVALFEVLKLDAKPKLTKTKHYCTDEEYLQFLADRHEIIPLILRYRGTKKLLSTYVEALPQLVNPITGRIHTSFNQAVTATGRLSSTNPNLQNIPIREEQGRRIRKSFVPSDAEHVLLAADYSQVELRLMAHLSGDKAMIGAFERGEDIHRDTASRLFHVAAEEVSAEQRRKAKTANFGIIYGISAFGLKQRIEGITMGEAKEIIEGYFASYPGVKEYMDRVVAQARNDGYVQTIFGRRRYLPDIRSANANARSLAERNAINAPIQGSAADIIKVAMNTVRRRLREEGLSSKVILQVHDELVLDVLRSELERVESIVRGSMEQAVELSVPLSVECGTGENWLEAH